MGKTKGDKHRLTKPDIGLTEDCGAEGAWAAYPSPLAYIKPPCLSQIKLAIWLVTRGPVHGP
jgi:hypothetical protein